jgi:hypothetical protein
MNLILRQSKRSNAFATFFSLLLIFSLIVSGVPVVAAAGEVSEINVYTSDDDDRDNDEKYSKFRVGVSANTQVGGFADASDPFLKIYINGQLIRTTDVNSVANFYREFDFSREELSHLDSGTPRIRIELWDDNIVGNDLEHTSEHTPEIEFEPAEEDRSDKKRALIGISSITDSYDDASEDLNVDALRSRQVNSITDAFEALLPLSIEEARDAAAISLLEQASSLAANAIDNAITVPTVINNVERSLEVGKQVNALQNTDRTTRSEFHRNLNELASQDVPTDPDEMSEAELRNRKDTLEDAYKATKEYRASVRRTWDTGALRGHVPSWMVELYGADQEALTKIQGQFTQLEQLLIVDYYYTQKALNPDSNVQLQNLTTVTTWREPSYPTAKIVDSDIPDEITVGETATASVTVKTKNNDTPSQTITIGLPDDDSLTNVRILQNGIKDPSYSTVYSAQSDLWTGYGDSQKQVPYTVVETAGPMSEGSTHTFEIQFRPTSAGSVRLWLKSVAWTGTDTSGGLSPYPRGDPQSQDGVVIDGQDELAEERSINVIDPDPAQFDIAAVDTNSPVQAGEDVAVTATVENTGDVEDTQSVEVTVPGVGSDSNQVPVSGGSSETVSLAVSTQSGDSGTHTATVESENDDASTPVEITEQPDASNFDVKIDSTNEPVEAGNRLELTATIENTGDLEDTQPVELTVPGVGSDSKQVTVPGGDSETVSLAVSTQSGDSGTHTATVESENDDASTSVEITERSDASNFEVKIDSTNSPTEAGNQLTLTAEITNNGDTTGTQSINADAGDLGSDSARVTLDSGESSTVSFSIPTETGDADNYVVTVSSNNATAQGNVEIRSNQRNSPFDVTITESNTPIEAGGSAEVTVEITNTGNIPATKIVETDAGSLGNRSKSVSLEGGATTTKVYSFPTSSSDTGEYTAIVDSPGDDDTVELSVTEPQSENDQYEPNDDLDTATTLSDGSYTDLQIVDGESDYFAVELDRGDSFNASISFDHTTGDLDLHLLNPNGQTIEASDYTSDGESVRIDTATETGTYYLRVDGFNDASASYDLAIAVESSLLTAQNGVAVQEETAYVVSEGNIVTVDLDTGDVTNRFDAPEGRPDGLAYGDGSLWFADGVDSNFDGEVIELDPETGDIRSQIQTSYDPTGLAYGEGSLWVGDITTNTVVEYTPSGNRLNAFDIRRPTGTTSPRGLAYGIGSLWLGTDDGSLYEFAPNGTLRAEHDTRQTAYRGLGANETALFGPTETGNLDVLRGFDDSRNDNLVSFDQDGDGTISIPEMLSGFRAYDNNEQFEGKPVGYRDVLANARAFHVLNNTTDTDPDASVYDPQGVDPRMTSFEVDYVIRNRGTETANFVGLNLSTPPGVEVEEIGPNTTYTSVNRESTIYGPASAEVPAGESILVVVEYSISENVTTDRLIIEGTTTVGSTTTDATTEIGVERGDFETPPSVTGVSVASPADTSAVTIKPEEDRVPVEFLVHYGRPVVSDGELDGGLLFEGGSVNKSQLNISIGGQSAIIDSIQAGPGPNDTTIRINATVLAPEFNTGLRDLTVEVTLPPLYLFDDHVLRESSRHIDTSPDSVTYESSGRAEYANQEGVVETSGLIQAINDWRNGETETTTLLEIITAWRSGGPIA